MHKLKKGGMFSFHCLLTFGESDIIKVQTVKKGWKCAMISQVFVCCDIIDENLIKNNTLQTSEYTG
jgi:hypothetical protein